MPNRHSIKRGLKKNNPGIWSYLYMGKRSHKDLQLQEAANPQLHRHLEACLPLKLTGAEWLSQPVQGRNVPLGMRQGWKTWSHRQPTAGVPRLSWNASWLSFSQPFSEAKIRWEHWSPPDSQRQGQQCWILNQFSLLQKWLDTILWEGRCNVILLVLYKWHLTYT